MRLEHRANMEPIKVDRNNLYSVTSSPAGMDSSRICTGSRGQISAQQVSKM